MRFCDASLAAARQLQDIVENHEAWQLARSMVERVGEFDAAYLASQYSRVSIFAEQERALWARVAEEVERMAGATPAAEFD